MEFEQWLSQSSFLLPLSRIIMWATVAYLVSLGVTALCRPGVARSFLEGFAANSARNLFEGALRGLVGLSFIGVAPVTRLPLASFCIGIFLIATALLMALLPRLHLRIARRATGPVVGMFPLFEFLSLGLAALLAWFII